MDYEINLGGINFLVPVRSGTTIERFTPFSVKSDSIEPVDIISEKEVMHFIDSAGSISLKIREFTALIIPVSDHLLRYHCCIFHGLSVSLFNKGFLFCGPSGVGKTTQYCLWKEMYKDEVCILNGDKPILEWIEIEKRFILHPSPWTGKENYFSMNKKKLEGIVYLEQGSVNKIERANNISMVIPLIQQVFYSAVSIDLIDEVTSITDGLLKYIPIWKLTNRGDMQSVIMMHDMLEDYFKGKDDGTKDKS